MINEKGPNNRGFTLIELLIAMVISLVVMAAIYKTFKTQQDAYVVQTQVSAMQQNLRAAMFMMTRDIQMAGYYTNFDTKTYDATADAINWDPTTTDNESTRPVIYGRNNDSTSDDVKDDTDVIVIIKASNDDNDVHTLSGAAGETASTNSLSLSDNHLDFGEDDFGVLIKKNFSRAEVFQVSSVSGGAITLKNNLEESYGAEARLFVADVVVYSIDDSDPDHPCLKRRNLGTGGSFQTVAENVENLQIQYHLNDGTTVNSVSGAEGANVRAVEIALLARTDNEIRGYTFNKSYGLGWATLNPSADGYQRRLLHSTIKTRNIGL